MSAMDNEDMTGSSVASSHEFSSKKIRKAPTCRLCKNHNIVVRSKNHKRWCPGQRCICTECCKVRKKQNKSASDTKETRAKQQDKELENVISKEDTVNGKAKTDFIFPKEYEDETVQFKKGKKERKEAKNKGKKRQANEKIFESNRKRKTDEEPNDNNLEDLLRYTLCNCLIYDIRDTTIWVSFVNEIVAFILKYGRSSNSSADAENSLYEAKNRIFNVISEIRRLMTHYGICCYFSPSSTVQQPTYMRHFLNGIETSPQSPYLWSTWPLNHLTGSANMPPYTDTSPKPSIEHSPYYRAITGQ